MTKNEYQDCARLTEDERKEYDKMVYALAELDYTANGDDWREKMAEEENDQPDDYDWSEDGEDDYDNGDFKVDPRVFEKEEVIEYIVNQYELTLEELREASK